MCDVNIDPPWQEQIHQWNIILFMLIQQKHQSHTTPCIEWHIMPKTKNISSKIKPPSHPSKKQGQGLFAASAKTSAVKRPLPDLPPWNGKPIPATRRKFQSPGWEKHLIYKFVAAGCVLESSKGFPTTSDQDIIYYSMTKFQGHPVARSIPTMSSCLGRASITEMWWTEISTSSE